MKRFALIVCLLFTFTFQISANIYKKYDVRSGLSGNCVRSILQDSIGYMWFATQDGLNRFNGIEFTNYGHSSESGDNSYMNIVTICRHQDNNHIWVASTEKLYLFDSRQETFSVFDKQTEDGVSVNSAFGLAYDHYGQLWIGTANGLFVYNEQKGTLRQYLHSLSNAHSLPDNHVWVIYSDSFGTIWIGTRNGLAKYNQRTDNFTIYLSEGTSFGRPACNEIISLMESSQGVLWAGTWYGGLARFNKETGQFRYYFGEGDSLAIPRIRVLFQRTANSFYLGSDDGLYTFNTTTEECLPTDDKQAKESIYACYQDREGGIWIGTYFSGASYLSPKHKDIEWYYPNGTENSLSGNVISQFCEDANGNIWIATEDGGLNVFDPRTKKFRNHLLGGHTPKNIGYHNIHALLYDKGNLWIGSFSKGLYILNIETGKTKNYRHNRANSNSIPNDHIYSIYKTKNGTIYLGTLAGFCQYDPKSDSFRSLEVLSHIFIYDIIEDRHKNLWLASKRDGIWRYNPATGKLHNYRNDPQNPNSPCSNWVIRAYIDHKQDLWFCTEGGGICRYLYQQDHFENFSTKENLPNNIIYGILDDQSGNYWLSSNRGLIRYEPQNKRAQLYTIEDGLQSNQFNFRSSLQASDGKFYFGGVNGFNSFHPFKLSINKVKPTASISAVYMHSPDDKISRSKRVSALSGKITIPYQVVSFDVMFESLSYVAPSKNLYAYKLDGIHKEWIYTDKHNVSFLNLPPGEYTFRVKSSNNDEYWSNDDSCLHIEVLPPPWKTIYAKILYLLLACGFTYFSVKLYLRKQQVVKQRKMKEIEQIKNQELFQSKITFFTQVAHEIKTPVSLIKAPLEAILETHEWNSEVESNLSVIKKNTNRLMELIKQLLDFRKVDKEGYTLSFNQTDINRMVEDIIERFRAISLTGISFNISLPKEHLQYNIDQEALTKIISNLLANAMKYAHTQIMVILDEYISSEKRTLSICVRDDGPGVPKDEWNKVFEPFYQAGNISNNGSGVGIGLSLVKLLVERHNGVVYINPNYTEGCEVCVKIPYLEKSTSANHSIISMLDEDLILDEGTELSGYSLLVVEDTTDMLEFLAKNLSNTYTIYTAANGEEALMCLEKITVDIIISDIIMPKMDGFELLKSIRSDSMLCHIPFILLSALDSIDSKITGLDYGADAYIEKPFSLNHMKATINNLLENRRMLFNHFTTVPNMSYDQTLMNKTDVKWLNTINEIINNNFTNEEFTIDKLAEEMAISRSNLQRKLKGLTGMPPNDYIRLIRLKTAGELLCEGEYRINEVCYIVGFNNPSYFARCFQKQFGILPKDYAKKRE
ncbi:MAG TPA: response regulator [Bacteroides reticulotermitis]|nr:response regulator [Bacteroides reticulotermitis]